MGMVRQEIKHSNFLQFLLNPSEKHQLGDLFLKKLLIRHGLEQTSCIICGKLS
ncbi:MAG: PD-(D/E)XK nuclease family protein [Cyanobacteria bacterium P01_A01_bin.123]